MRFKDLRYQCIIQVFEQGNLMKSLLTWCGGKHRLSRHIAVIVDNTPHKAYVEPFCGAASIFFRKKEPIVTNFDNYRNVLNDIDDGLMKFYAVLQDEKKYYLLLEKLRVTPYGRNIRNEIMEIRRHPDNHDDVTIAWAVFCCAFMSFGSGYNTGFPSGIKGPNYAMAFHNKKLRLENRQAIVYKLNNTILENLDAIDLIRIYDSEHTLFYIDPPYADSYQGYKAPTYKEDDIKQLISVLENIKGKFILSHYPKEYFPDHWERKEFLCRVSINNKRACHTTDLVFTNYKLPSEESFVLS